MPALAFPILAVLTDRTLLSPNWTLAQAIAPAVSGGANLVILRETDLPDGPRLTVARFVRDGVRGRVPYVLSRDPLLARQGAADGAHLDEPADIASARRLLSGGTIGVTVCNPTGIRRAHAESADYALAVLDWSDPTRALQAVRDLAEAAPRFPLVAGTDVPLNQVRACLDAGASGIAVCQPAMAAYNRTQALREYAQALALPRLP